MLVLRLNWTLITLSPSVLDEVIWATPGISPNCSSSGLVTVAAMVCGSAPGSWEVTLIVG